MTKYEMKVKPYLEQVKDMARNGLTQQQMAINLGVNFRTFQRYIENEQELRDAVNSGREYAVREIENALFKAALGEKVVLKKAMKVKKVVYENGRKKGEVETTEPYVEEVYVKPDTQAGIFLLKNWAKDNYSNDPLMYDLKKREQELKERMADVDTKDEFDPFS